MNEPRSSRYHRARRRAGAIALGLSALLLAALALTGGSLRLRDVVGGSVGGYVVLLAGIHAAVAVPMAWYRGYRLERQFELSRMSLSRWCEDYLKSVMLGVFLSVAAASAIYFAMRTWPEWWWLAAAAGGTAAQALLTLIAPVFVLPLFHSSRPLARDGLQQRLLRLSAKAGVPVLSAREWVLGEKTRRANAALVGVGSTRRILLSDTLLAEYSDDEIEVVMAHEIGHHVHGDVMKGLLGEFLVLTAGFYASAVTLDTSWRWLGLHSAADAAGLPVMLLALGTVSLAATPLLNAWSRRNERRADRFALELTSRPDAFITAMRRMAAQNLAEERPPVTARWFFNTHPSVEERIDHARELLDRPRS